MPANPDQRPSETVQFALGLDCQNWGLALIFDERQFVCSRFLGREGRMAGRVTSVFFYVKDVRKSLEFYNEVVGAEIIQIHAEHEGGPYTLAIMRIGQFTIMLHPQEPHADEFTDTRVGVGIHLQLQVPDVDAFFQHCMDEGAILSLSGEPTDQSWGWREFALRDPDGYIWSVYQDKSGGQWTL
jgi:uncharacterized glyoxalase superfamily protein PhnB